MDWFKAQQIRTGIPQNATVADLNNDFTNVSLDCAENTLTTGQIL